MKINIPSKLQTIQNYTFSDCQNLTSITIPSNIQSIQQDAFYYCINLQCVNIQNQNCQINQYAFNVTKYQQFTSATEFNQDTCPQTIFVGCQTQDIQYKYYSINSYCVDSIYVTYYYIKNNESYYVPYCRFQRKPYIQNENPPYECVSQCAKEYAKPRNEDQDYNIQCDKNCSFWFQDITAQYSVCTVIEGKCNTNRQLKSYYTETRLQCVIKCSDSLNQKLKYNLSKNCVESCGSSGSERKVWYYNQYQSATCRNETKCYINVVPPEYLDIQNDYQCVKCSEGYNYIYNNSCAQSCVQNENYYISTDSQECVKNCSGKMWYHIGEEMMCSNEENCDQIQNLHYEIENSSECVNQCPEQGEHKYVYEYKCLDSCMNVENKFVASDSNQCVDGCGDGYVWSLIQQEQKCRNQQQCNEDEYIIYDYQKQGTIYPYNSQYQIQINDQPKQCVEQCQNNYAKEFDNFICNNTCDFILRDKEDINTKYCTQTGECSQEQLKSEFSEGRYQCVTNCTDSINELYYQQEQFCLKECQDEYAKPYNQDDFVCSNTCTYYILEDKQLKQCIEDDQCPQLQYLVKSKERQYCSQICPEKYKLKNNQCVKNNKSTVGLIIGIVVSVIVLIAIIVVVLIFIKKQKNQTKNQRNSKLQQREVEIIESK